VKEFRASSRSPERDFTELVRIFDIRQSQRQSLTEYLDNSAALTTPVAGYRLPLEAGHPFPAHLAQSCR
jgi:hypothetical protein